MALILPMSDHLTVRFEYSAADHADALAEERRSMFFGWWYRPLNIVVMAIIYGRQVARGGNDLLGNLILLAVLLPFAAFLIFMPEFVRGRERARLRREAAKRDDLVETRTFGPDGFRPGTHWPQPIPWSHAAVSGPPLRSAPGLVAERLRGYGPPILSGAAPTPLAAARRVP